MIYFLFRFYYLLLSYYIFNDVCFRKYFIYIYNNNNNNNNIIRFGNCLGEGRSRAYQVFHPFMMNFIYIYTYKITMYIYIYITITIYILFDGYI